MQKRKNKMKYTIDGPLGKSTVKVKTRKNPFTGRTTTVSKTNFKTTSAGRAGGLTDERVKKKTKRDKDGNIISEGRNTKKRMMGGKKKMYREGGSSNASYTYQDFLDL
jgi:hypothetical protein|tara:strand:- start:154 stop:477 length:324 start_codon:yes stop_codon:yes gene_type:complete